MPASPPSNVPCRRLDWVVPSWLTLTGPDLAFKANLDQRSLNYMRAHKPGVAILPMIQNASGGNWDGPGLARLLADPVRAERLADQIVAFLAANKLQGVTIDFENVPQCGAWQSGDFPQPAVPAFRAA